MLQFWKKYTNQKDYHNFNFKLNLNSNECIVRKSITFLLTLFCNCEVTLIKAQIKNLFYLFYLDSKNWNFTRETKNNCQNTKLQREHYVDNFYLSYENMRFKNDIIVRL